MMPPLLPVDPPSISRQCVAVQALHRERGRSRRRRRERRSSRQDRIDRDELLHRRVGVGRRDAALALPTDLDKVTTPFVKAMSYVPFS